MTHITEESLKQLAELSAIELTSSELDGLSGDLEKILSYIDQMQELNTDDVEPTYQVTDLQNVWRDDAVDNNGPMREALLSTAGQNTSNSQIKVPKVL